MLLNLQCRYLIGREKLQESYKERY